jgi:hypothetical protein
MNVTSNCAMIALKRWSRHPGEADEPALAGAVRNTIQIGHA